MTPRQRKQPAASREVRVSYGLFLRAKGAAGAATDRLRAMVEGFLGAGVRGDSARYFQVVIQALTLERVAKPVTALNARYLPLYAEVLEELLPADAGRRGTIMRLFGT